MNDSQRPIGQRFSELYIERGAPERDSARMRRRLAALSIPTRCSRRWCGNRRVQVLRQVHGGDLLNLIVVLRLSLIRLGQARHLLRGLQDLLERGLLLLCCNKARKSRRDFVLYDLPLAAIEFLDQRAHICRACRVAIKEQHSREDERHKAAGYKNPSDADTGAPSECHGVAFRVTEGHPACVSPAYQLIREGPNVGRASPQRLVIASKTPAACPPGALRRYLRAATFFSTTSQIIAAMSGPPNSCTWRVPMGEVTLISVRIALEIRLQLFGSRRLLHALPKHDLGVVRLGSNGRYGRQLQGDQNAARQKK